MENKNPSMSEDEIIKALECCSSDEVGLCHICPLDGECNGDITILLKYALDLINRQKAEIESLKIANEKMYIANKKQEKNIDRLEHQLEALCLTLKLAKAEAIKEFAERLKVTCYTYSDICGYESTVIDVSKINNLVKEMVGDTE